ANAVGPNSVLYADDEAPATDELRYWLPSRLGIVDRNPGGPYREELAEPGLRIRVTHSGQVQFVPLDRLSVEFYVTEESSRAAQEGARIVEAVISAVAGSRPIEHLAVAAERLRAEATEIGLAGEAIPARLEQRLA